MGQLAGRGGLLGPAGGRDGDAGVGGEVMHGGEGLSENTWHERKLQT